MSNYNKATNFAVKDTLTSGDPEKVVSGAEIDNEFNSISSAVNSKADKVAAATTDNFAALDANGNIKDSGSNQSAIESFVSEQKYEDSDALNLFNVTGEAPVYACRAWVNFDGTGTVSIRESGNVSSITDNGTGRFTANLTSAMPDANFAVVIAGQARASLRANRCTIGRAKSTTEAQISSVSVGAGTFQDLEFFNIAVFR